MPRYGLLLLLSLALGFAPAPFPRTERRARPGNEIVGLWQGGINTDVSRRPNGSDQLLITADRMIYHPGRAHSVDYVLRLDLSVRPATYHIKGAPKTSAEGRQGRGIW